MAKEKYTKLLKDRDIERWYENVARGSRITADIYLRRLGGFCEKNKVNPKDLLKLTDDELYNLVLDEVTKLEKEGKAGSYQYSILKAIKSWLSFSGKELKRKIKIKDAHGTPTLEREKIPTQPELKKIFLASSSQQRVACVLLAHSGLRIEVLGNYRGTDGLRLRDFLELDLENLEFKKIPAQILIRKKLSKAGNQYLTFLSEEGCGYLKDYLEQRKEKEEKLTENSSVLAPKKPVKAFITTAKVGELIRRVFRKVGFQGRPYVLRSYFDTQLMLAESKGYCLRDYRTFWMGHKGDIEHTYTLNKGKLPPKIIEDMRQAYEKSQEFLQTEVTTPKEKEIKDLFKRELLDVFGFGQEEVGKILSENPSKEELKQKIREKLLGKRFYPNGDCPTRQKVVSLAELGKYLEEGWEFVTQLPENKVIIRFAESLA